LQNELALFSLVFTGDAAHAGDRLRADSAAPERFAKFVDRHGLRLFLRTAIEGDDAGAAHLASALPADWLGELSAFGARQIERQRALVRELARVDGALRGCGIEPIALKGAYAALRFHGGLERRAFSDLDLLVQPRQLDTAERVLSSSGFQRRSSILVSRRLTTRFTHAFDFAGHGVLVDLHWRLFPHPSFRADETRPWRIRRTWTIEGRSYRVLPEDDEVRFGLISVFRDIERGAGRIKHIADLLRMLDALDGTVDWAELLAALRAERMLAVAVNVLRLALDCLPGPERLAGLVAAADAHRSLLVAGTPESRRALLESPQGALANKRWAAQIYESSRLASLAWWGASLPFRLAVHHPGKLARWGRRLRGAAARSGSRRASAAGSTR